MEKTLKEFNKDSSKRRDIAGYILERAITTEYHLSQLLAAYFIENQDKQVIFIKEILNKEFFTLQQKIRALRKLKFKENINLDKEFYKKLDYIRDTRNNIAHSIKEYDEEKDCFKIEYKKNHKIKIIYFNEELVNEFGAVSREVDKVLSSVKERLKKIKIIPS